MALFPVIRFGVLSFSKRGAVQASVTCPFLFPAGICSAQKSKLGMDHTLASTSVSQENSLHLKNTRFIDFAVGVDKGDGAFRLSGDPL